MPPAKSQCGHPEHDDHDDHERPQQRLGRPEDGLLIQAEDLEEPGIHIRMLSVSRVLGQGARTGKEPAVMARSAGRRSFGRPALLDS